MERHQIVIDASAAIKWYFTDESDAQSAADMLLDYQQNKVCFIVPSLFHYEIMNSVHIAVRIKRIPENSGKEILEDIFLIETIVVNSDKLIKSAYLYARQYNISVYNASYFAAAKEHNAPIYTADRRFYNAVKSKERLMRWIGDYKKAG
jgi:predicted nucleic acid-binding protein